DPKAAAFASLQRWSTVAAVSKDAAKSRARALLKRTGRHGAVQGALAWTAAGHIRAVRSTTRWQTVNGEAAAVAWSGERPAIVAFWHNRLLLMPYCWRSTRPF